MTQSSDPTQTIRCKSGKHKRDIYLGTTDHGKVIFRAKQTPTSETHSAYRMVIGPFKTIRGATYMKQFSEGNPHCQCVKDAERLAVKYKAFYIRCERKFAPIQESLL